MMTPRRVRLIAWSIVGLTALAWAASALLVARSGPSTGVFEIRPPIGSWMAQAAAGLAFMVFPVTGAFIASRRPAHPIGWLFLGTGLLAVANLANVYAYHALDTNPGSLPGGAVVQALLSDGLWLPAVAITTVLMFLFFPNGTLHSRAERVTAWAAVGAAILGGPIAGATEKFLYPAPQIANPLPIRSDAVSSILFGIGFLTLITCVVASMVLLVLRFRRSRGEERQQLKWFLFASSFVLVTTIALNLFESPPLLLSVATVIALVVLSVTVAIAILRYRLFDIDVVIRKTVIYANLAGLIVVLGIGGLVIAGGAIGGPGKDGRFLIALGALLGIAIWPLRRVATVFADKIVFGGRRTPYEVLTDFSNRVGETYSSEDVLRRMAQVVGTALGARAAVIWLRVAGTFQPAATWPADAQEPGSVPEDAVQVWHQGEVLGAIFVTMPANDPMSEAKRGLISDLAKQAGPVLRNVRLVEELRESRRRIVATADERARALERNIHDGAQQQLVALAVKQRIAASLVGNDDDRARRILEELQAETNAALEDLRDLARGIYPPLLADQGLVAALSAQARKAAVPVEVDADGIGRFGQDVEAAVYFSCLEALQNVAKYAEASLATLALRTTGTHLTFEVRDDGRGFDPTTLTRGTGLQGIDDRLSALGGELHIRSSPGTGTTIEGTVPTGGYDQTTETWVPEDSSPVPGD